MKPKVLITRAIPPEALVKLKEEYELLIWDKEDTPISKEWLAEKIPGIDGLYCLLTDTIDAALIEKAEKLKVISNMAAGYNNIDLEAATKKGILVTNTPGILTETTADLTFSLLLATSRRLVEASEFLKEGRWRTWSPMLLTGQDVYGATLGIIGLGKIGEALARRAKGFGMEILYYNRSSKRELEQELGLVKVEMEELLKHSDFVCVLIPYTDDTRNLVGKQELEKMKATSILINTARGGIVNEKDLYEALIENKIWAAGLDVFEQEPISLGHPLLTLPNVVALPHIGSASEKTRIKMAVLATENLVLALSGSMPKNVVNKEVLENV